MTQSRKPRGGHDEGAACAAAVMAEVKRLRQSRAWTAERLAGEMTAAGVPWTRDTVVNLENGRRKWLAVHELLALARLLDIAPVHLLAGLDDDVPVPVTPGSEVGAADARDWIRGISALPGGDPVRYRASVPASEANAYFVMIEDIRDRKAVESAIEGLEIFVRLAGMDITLPRQVVFGVRRRPLA